MWIDCIDRSWWSPVCHACGWRNRAFRPLRMRPWCWTNSSPSPTANANPGWRTDTSIHDPGGCRRCPWPQFFKELVLDGQAANALVCHLLFLLEARYFLRLLFDRPWKLVHFDLKTPVSIGSLGSVAPHSPYQVLNSCTVPWWPHWPLLPWRPSWIFCVLRTSVTV